LLDKTSEKTTVVAVPQTYPQNAKSLVANKDSFSFGLLRRKQVFVERLGTPGNARPRA
jgi:hypothetical protein